MTTVLARPSSLPTAAMVSVDSIRFHPRNIRTELGDLRELTASIAAEGVLQPLLVHRTATGLQAVDGHRRLASARIAGLRKVPVLIVDELDDDEAITKMLATTLKSGVSREERRAALRSLTEEFGHTRRGLAERFGVSVNTVVEWMADDTAREQKRAANRSWKRHQVSPHRIDALIDQWQDKATCGLTAAEATELLAELRSLTSRASAPSSPEVTE